jgi:ABC-2 type transport system ATP-binding protein
LTHKADTNNAVQTLRQYSIGEIQTDTGQRHIIVPVTQGSQILAAVVRDLDAAQISVADLSLRRPTLDDVFLTLTGRAAEETDELIDISAARPLERSTR